LKTETGDHSPASFFSAIAVGWHARFGAVALGLFCLATAILFHTNFAVRNELLHFEKDLPSPAECLY
jgi:uncharacterized membrane protein YphA (DoxX/SURF4 family)